MTFLTAGGLLKFFPLFATKNKMQWRERERSINYLIFLFILKLYFYLSDFSPSFLGRMKEKKIYGEK